MHLCYHFSKAFYNNYLEKYHLLLTIKRMCRYVHCLLEESLLIFIQWNFTKVSLKLIHEVG